MSCLTDRLPKPDQFGSYWLGPRPIGAAIFRSHLPGKNGPQYFASTGSSEGQGVLFSQSGIWYFDSPEEAHKALRHVM
jgi:hypothetical protein